MAGIHGDADGVYGERGFQDVPGEVAGAVYPFQVVPQFQDEGVHFRGKKEGIAAGLIACCML